MSTITTSKILDDTYNTIVKYAIEGDAGGDYLVDVLYDHTHFYNKEPLKRLYKIEYALTGFDAILYWDGTAVDLLVTLEKDHHEHACFEWCGGLSNKNIAGANGDILITTSGLTTAKNGYIILYLKHKQIVR